ncbi:MAG: acetolactate synthase large subunit, partial [Pseudomonadota bacterium]
FNIPAKRIQQKNQVPDAIDEFLKTSTAFLLHVCIDPQSNVWPLVPPGANNQQMMKEVDS